MPLQGPRAIGEILSDSASLLRRHLRVILLVTLPFCAAELALREAGLTIFSTLMKKLLAGAEAGDMGDLSVLGSRFLVGVALFFGSIVLAQLLSGALVDVVARAVRDEEAEPRHGFLALLRRGPALLFTLFVWLLGFLLVGIGPALLPLGALYFQMFFVGAGLALVWVLVAAVGVVALGLHWAVWPQVVVLEGASGPRALRRSGELMASRGIPFHEGSKFRLSVLYLVYFGIASTLQSLFMIPRFAVAFFTGALLDGPPPLVSMPLWFMIPFALLEVVTNALVIPLSTILTTSFYFDLRVRFEGLDLDEEAPTEEEKAAA